MIISSLAVEDFFYPEDGGSNLLQNVSTHLPDYMALHPRHP
jgi:hypothetical protein